MILQSNDLSVHGLSFHDLSAHDLSAHSLSVHALSVHALSVHDQVRYETSGRRRTGRVEAMRHDDQSGELQAAVAPATGGPRVWLAVAMLTPAARA